MHPHIHRHIFFLVLALFLFLGSTQNASALSSTDAAYWNMNRAVSGVVSEAAEKRGFTMRDPRIGNTLARISPHLSVIGGTAAAVTVGAVTAPAWASVALAIGIGVVVPYAVSLAIDGIVNWLFRSDGTIDESSEAPPVQSTTSMAQGGPYWAATVGFPKSYTAYSGDGEALARQSHADDRRRMGMSVDNNYTCRKSGDGGSWFCGQGTAAYYKTGAPGTCTSGGMLAQGNCTGFDYLPAPVKPESRVPISTAASHIPDSDLKKKLNPVIVAALANQAWQHAASQPGYDGLPYPQSNPITAEEATSWAQAHPEYWPSVSDFVSPRPETQTSTDPWSLLSNPASPGTSTPARPNEGTTNPASNQPLANLGADPGIGFPQLEEIPTAQKIAAPILQLAPDLRAFEAQGVAGSCPRPSIELYGTHVIEAHCKLIDDNKPVLRLAMVFAWAALALVIILSA